MSDMPPPPPPPIHRTLTQQREVMKQSPGHSALGVGLVAAAPACALASLLLMLRYSNVDGYSSVENPTLTLVFLALTPLSFVGCLVAGIYLLVRKR